MTLFRVSLRVVLLRGARGAALEGAQAGLPRNLGITACCRRRRRCAGLTLFRVSLRVVLLRGARGAALEGAQAHLPRNHGITAGCRGGGRCAGVTLFVQPTKMQNPRELRDKIQRN